MGQGNTLTRGARETYRERGALQLLVRRETVGTHAHQLPSRIRVDAALGESTHDITRIGNLNCEKCPIIGTASLDGDARIGEIRLEASRLLQTVCPQSLNPDRERELLPRSGLIVREN